MRDLIRRDQVRAEKLNALQEAISQGLASGAPQPFDSQEFNRRMMKVSGNSDL